MIRMPGEDRERSVHLLRKDDTCQLMRECDPPQREEQIGTLAGCVGPTVRRADGQDQPLDAVIA